MEKEHDKARQALHAELLVIIGPEAPGGWIIALVKVDLDGAAGEVRLDHVDSTGHVLWHDNKTELLGALHAALRRHREDGGAAWTRASLVLSPAELLSADFRQ